MPTPDEIPEAQRGQRPSADGWNVMRDLHHRTHSAVGTYEDQTGVHHRRLDDEIEGVIRYELSADHSPGNTTQAFPRNWNGTAWVTDTEADTISVVDVDSEFRGRGRDEEASAETDSEGTRGKHGSFGRATFRSGQYEIDSMSRHATGLTATAESDFTTSTSPIPVENVAVTKPVKTALLMMDVGTGSDGVHNRHSHSGDEGFTLTIEWDDSHSTTGRYAEIQVDC